MSAKRPPYRTALAIWRACAQPILCRDIVVSLKRPLGTVKAALGWLGENGYLARRHIAGRRVLWAQQQPLPPAKFMPSDKPQIVEPWDFTALLEAMPLSHIRAAQVRRLRERARTRLPTRVHNMEKRPRSPW